MASAQDLADELAAAVPGLRVIVLEDQAAHGVSQAHVSVLHPKGGEGELEIGIYRGEGWARERQGTKIPGHALELLEKAMQNFASSELAGTTDRARWRTPDSHALALAEAQERRAQEPRPKKKITKAGRELLSRALKAGAKGYGPLRSNERNAARALEAGDYARVVQPGDYKTARLVGPKVAELEPFTYPGDHTELVNFLKRHGLRTNYHADLDLRGADPWADKIRRSIDTIIRGATAQGKLEEKRSQRAPLKRRKPARDPGEQLADAHQEARASYRAEQLADAAIMRAGHDLEKIEKAEARRDRARARQTKASEIIQRLEQQFRDEKAEQPLASEALELETPFERMAKADAERGAKSILLELERPEPVDAKSERLEAQVPDFGRVNPKPMATRAGAVKSQTRGPVTFHYRNKRIELELEDWPEPLIIETTAPTSRAAWRGANRIQHEARKAYEAHPGLKWPVVSAYQQAVRVVGKMYAEASKGKTHPPEPRERKPPEPAPELGRWAWFEVPSADARQAALEALAEYDPTGARVRVRSLNGNLAAALQAHNIKDPAEADEVIRQTIDRLALVGVPVLDQGEGRRRLPGERKEHAMVYELARDLADEERGAWMPEDMLESRQTTETFRDTFPPERLIHPTNRGSGRTLFLISCGADKLDHAAPAAELYTGPLFRAQLELARRWSELEGGQIRILSAKHGIVKLDQELEPYDVNLSKLPKAERDAWTERVRQRLLKLTKPGDEIVGLLPAAYAEWSPALEKRARTVLLPLAGLQVGQRKRALKLALEDNRSRWDVAELKDQAPVPERGIETARELEPAAEAPEPPKPKPTKPRRARAPKVSPDELTATSKARRVYLDELTGAPVGTTPAPGTIPAEQWLARVRPRKDAKLEDVDIDQAELGRLHEAWGIELTRGELKKRAAELARARSERAKRVRIVAKRKGKQEIPGVLTTFRTAGKAAAEFMDRNSAFVTAATQGNLDIGDALEEWMDRRSVWTPTRGGKRKGYHRSLNKTKKGEAIRTAGNDQNRLEAALTWTFSQAKSKRYADVSWSAIDDLGEQLLEAFNRQDVSLEGYPATGWTWYPVASGQLEPAQIVEQMGDRPDIVRAVLTYYNSAALERELENIAAAYKAARKCLTKNDRAVVNRRIKQLRVLLEDPETLAEADVCGADPNVRGLCSFAGVDREIRRLRAGCPVENGEPYSPDGPLRLASELLAEPSKNYAELATFPDPVLRRAQFQLELEPYQPRLEEALELEQPPPLELEEPDAEFIPF